jgi:hypothetical protein
LAGVLAVSVVAAVAIKNSIDQGSEVIVEGNAMQPDQSPVPTMSSGSRDPSAPLKNGIDQWVQIEPEPWNQPNNSMQPTQ